MADQRGSNPWPVIPYTWTGATTSAPVSGTNPLPVSVTSGGATPIVSGGAQTAVPVSTTSVPLVAASATRIRLWLHNDGPNTAYLNFLAVATVAAGIPFPMGADLFLDGDDAKLAWNAICNTAESASIRVAIGGTV